MLSKDKTHDLLFFLNCSLGNVCFCVLGEGKLHFVCFYITSLFRLHILISHLLNQVISFIVSVYPSEFHYANINMHKYIHVSPVLHKRRHTVLCFALFHLLCLRTFHIVLWKASPLSAVWEASVKMDCVWFRQSLWKDPGWPASFALTNLAGWPYSHLVACTHR